MQAFIGIPSKADWHIGNNIHTFTFLLDYKFLPVSDVNTGTCVSLHFPPMQVVRCARG